MVDGRIAVVGAGRVGSLLVEAFSAASEQISGPHGRGYAGVGDRVVFLCVPDSAIGVAAREVTDGPLLAHCSGATSLDVFAGRRGLSVHPVMTVTAGATPDVLAGVAAAVAGTDPAAAALAADLARTVGLRPFTVRDSDRAAYHAATSMAANFEVTLMESAAALARSAGVDPAVLVPLARQALDNWASAGPSALTGPIARGDLATVAAHRDAIEARVPHSLALYDVLAAATADLVRTREPARSGHLAGTCDLPTEGITP